GAQAAPVAARRADRRYEPDRDSRNAGAGRRTEGRGADDPADRAQARIGHAALRPCHRHGRRQEDCRGRRRASAERCQGDRSIPRSRSVAVGGRYAGDGGMNSTAPSSEPLWRLSNVNTFYGQAQVHFDLSIDVPRGHIVCLLGGNASGKSTTMKIILGLVKPRSGEVTFDGASLLGLSTPQIVRRGIASVPEARRLFADMSVRENVLMGAFVRNDRAEVANDLERMLALFPKLGQRLSQRA